MPGEFARRADGRDLDIRRLEIPVDDPLLVRRFQRFSDFFDELRRLAPAK